MFLSYVTSPPVNNLKPEKEIVLSCACITLKTAALMRQIQKSWMHRVFPLVLSGSVCIDKDDER